METVKGKKGLKVTEEVFETVKLLCKGGASIDKCASITGLSHATITYIKRANTYEEYKDIVYKNSSGYKNKLKKEEEAKAIKEKEATVPKEEEAPTPHVVEHHQTVTIVADQYMAEQLKKQTELLTLINNKLTLIAEDLGCFKEDKRIG